MIIQDLEKQYLDQRDDDFGLPEVNYRPIERELHTPAVFEPAVYYSDQDEPGIKKGWLMVLIIGLFSGMCFAIYLIQ